MTKDSTAITKGIREKERIQSALNAFRLFRFEQYCESHEKGQGKKLSKTSHDALVANEIYEMVKEIADEHNLLVPSKTILIRNGGVISDKAIKPLLTLIRTHIARDTLFGKIVFLHYFGINKVFSPYSDHEMRFLKNGATYKMVKHSNLKENHISTSQVKIFKTPYRTPRTGRIDKSNTSVWLYEQEKRWNENGTDCCLRARGTVQKSYQQLLFIGAEIYLRDGAIERSGDQVKYFHTPNGMPSESKWLQGISNKVTINSLEPCAQLLNMKLVEQPEKIVTSIEKITDTNKNEAPKNPKVNKSPWNSLVADSNTLLKIQSKK